MRHSTLHVRSLGRVRYGDALALQHGLFRRSAEDYLLLLEHSPVYTMGVRAKDENVLVDPDVLDADFHRVDRGGDVTFHGPGQLVGYPILNISLGPGAIPRYVWRVENVIVESLKALGLSDVGRLEGYPGVWVDPDGSQPRKICAVGTRVSKGRTMHGFALNVDPDLEMFSHIVPCGIADRAVTSLSREGIAATVAKVAELVIANAALLYDEGAIDLEVERQDATPPAAPVSVTLGSARPGRSLERRLVAAGVDTSMSVPIVERKPSFLRVEAHMGEDYLRLRKTMRSLDLVTVCEEAGCPNIYECWADGTATFMINGERCTRACGFCLVDTRHPFPLDPGEPERVARAVSQMGLSHAVVTAVARDDLEDGGAGAFAKVIEAIRRLCPTTSVEVLIPDCKGKDDSLRTIFAARPAVLNHNIETVLRLQRAVRPSASYARSLSVLARAKTAGLTTKSGIILGMGESEDEVRAALLDLSGVGVDIVTIGQYLRPSVSHLPVARYWAPDEFERLGDYARGLGFSHVESSPLTRSSYHARRAVESVASAVGVTDSA